jgi:hypothetical protein
MPHDPERDGARYVDARPERVRHQHVARCRRRAGGALVVEVLRRPGVAPTLGLRVVDAGDRTHVRLELDASEFSALAAGMRATRAS